MSLFPRMLYRYPGSVQLQDGGYETLVVHDEEAWLAAAGFHATPAAARAAAAPVEPAQAAPGAADAPPTRAELEQKATELGIPFDGRTSDRKLSDKIAAALG